MAKSFRSPDRSPAGSSSDSRARWRALVSTLAVVVIAAGLVTATLSSSGNASTDEQSGAGTAWVSGEQRGRLILAASGSEIASVALNVGSSADEYDLVDTGTLVYAHLRRTGVVVKVDAIKAEILSRGPAPTIETGADPVVVRAGEAVYVLDTSAGSVRRIGRDGAPDRTVVVGPFERAAGTSDGRLWMVRSSSGTYTVTDGQTTTTNQVAAPGDKIDIVAMGSEPILVNRSHDRLRWLRRDVGFKSKVPLGNAIVQQSSPRDGCLSIATRTVIACFDLDGLVRSAAIAPVNAPQLGTRLFASRGYAAFVTPGEQNVSMLTWVSSAWASAKRLEPSARQPVLADDIGALLVDDPGSRFALTVSGGRLVNLDKFSRRTVVANEQGTAGDGIAVASGTGLEARVLGTQEQQQQPAVKGVATGGNDPPFARPDNAVVRSGRSISVPVLANDTDPQGDVLTVVEVGTPDQGEASIRNGSAVVFRAPVSFAGTITFPYTITDPGGLRSSSIVTVDVIGNEANTLPVAAPDAAVTAYGSSATIEVLKNDTDAEGDPLTITGVSRPTNGTASILGSSVRYAPATGFSGVDTLTYTIIDGFGGTATGTVTVTVEPATVVNRPPIAAPDRASGNTTQHIQVQVLQNDFDPDGDVLRVVEVSTAPGVTTSVIDSQVVDVVPASNISGPVALSYTIEDPGGLRSVGEIVVFVEPTRANRAPRAIDDNAVSPSAAVIIDVLSNDVDPDRDPLIVVGVSQPASGRVIRSSPSTVTYTPAADTTGTQVFTYVVSDPGGLTSTGRVFVQVIPTITAPPVALDDAVTGYPGEALTIRPLANDSDPGQLPFSLSGPPVVRAGTVTVNADQSLVFTPPTTALGSYTIDYTIQNSRGLSATGHIVVTIVSRPVVNRAPLAQDDRIDTKFNTPVTINVLANDADPDGDKVTITSVGAAANGTARIAGAAVQFTPASGFAGVASFTYTISDPGGATAVGTVVVSVTDRPKVAPVAVDDVVISVGGAPVSVDVVANDVDSDGANAGLQVQSATGPAGIAAAVGDNRRTITVTPPARPGSYRVTYTIVDADGLTATAALVVTVQAPPNRPPVARDDSVTTQFETGAFFDVLANDTDPDGGTISLVGLGVPGVGNANIVGAQIRYRPPAGFAGATSFTYTVRDAEGATATATVIVNVVGCSAASPVLNPDSAITPFNTPVSIDLFANDTSATGVLSLDQPSQGAVSAFNGGTVTYRPPLGFNGVATFTYRVTNACGIAASATVTISVNRAPNAVADVVTMLANQTSGFNVLANDTDPDGDPLRIIGVSGATNGSAAISANGLGVTFAPVAGFVGTAGFDYTISDAGGLRSTARVSVIVNLGNNDPVARTDTVTLLSGDSVVIDVLANDGDPDNDAISVVGVGPVDPALGALVNGIGSVRFTASATFVGTFSTQYSISDGRGGTATGTIVIAIEPKITTTTSTAPATTTTVAPPTTAEPPAPTTAPTTTVASPSSSPITFVPPPFRTTSSTTAPAPTTTVATPAPVTTGPATTGPARTAPITTVAPTTPAPTTPAPTSTTTSSTTAPPPPPNSALKAVNDSSTAAAGAPTTLDVLANDTDTGDRISISSVAAPPTRIGRTHTNGASIVFTPADEFKGTTVFPYTVSDGRNGSDTGDV
jgi:large repetitive protein